MQFNHSQFTLKSRWSLILIVLLGLLITITIVELQPDLKHEPQAHAKTSVNTIVIQPYQVAPSITGFGVVEADHKLEARAEISGRITYVHPELKKGAILPQGTLLIKIDDKDYELALRQAEADLLAKQANLKEMQLTIDNNELELKLAVEKLKVRENELNRVKKLHKSGSVSQSRLDQEQQNYLQQKQEVQKLKNLETTLPSDMAVVEAQIAIAEAKVKQSSRNLERTNITLPFDGRISQVSVEQEQYVSLNAPLFNAFGMEKMLITAQFPVDQFRQIAASFDTSKTQNMAQMLNGNMSNILSSLGLTAQTYIAGEPSTVWEAKVERLSDNLDPQSRTIGVTVSISGSYRQMVPGKRPPLLEGMYMEVKLQGATNDYIVIPRLALHKNEIYLVDEEQKLTRYELENYQLQNEIVLSNSMALKGKTLITSDVFPAVNGMAVKIHPDERTRALLTQWMELAQ
ncbi:efflux RND transporter periplasmic adaptor subunit [Aliikangiella sp. G2MR2-5]|uniref:efflux RND transporter periplasmic adaptor subunit n=1 Tax=Aliikangiella sp. G2MR2-5 TaxID=2788943 RepID=UPI0018ABB1D7|nr:HlyD family efflux transporter periplasmic adaptor subunit [Aliikangiella sp. G2MR2-5]